MKDALRTRLEFLWAKLAGRDVDIDTLTPDAPTNMVEKLMIETADRIANAEGGGGEKFVVTFEEVDETVSYDTNKAWTCDRTMSELLEAVVANKNIDCKFNKPGSGEYEGSVNQILGYTGPETPIDGFTVEFLVSIPFYMDDDRLDLIIAVWDNYGETVAESYPLLFTASDGGNNDFIVDFSTGGEDYTPKCNHTYSEIKSAVQSGKNIIVTFEGYTCGFLTDKNAGKHNSDYIAIFIDHYTDGNYSSDGPTLWRFRMNYQDLIVMERYLLAPYAITLTDTTYNLVPQSNITYVFSAAAMDRLTITGNAAYCEGLTIIFNTGSTPNVVTYGVVLPAGHTWEANTHYKLVINDGYVEVSKWPIS